MKKKSRKKWIFLAVLVLIIAAAAAILVPKLLRARDLEAYIQQQNYVASKLLEMGSYEEARTLAAKSNEMKSNDISKELFVLAMGFQGDYETGVDYADKYLTDADDEVLDEARGLYQDFLEQAAGWLAEYEEADSYDALEEYEEKISAKKETLAQSLLSLVLDVQKNIDADVNKSTLQALLNVMTAEDTYEITEDDLDELEEEEDSQIAKQALLDYAVDTDDYKDAYELAEELFEDNQTFSSRSTLANVVAEWGTELTKDDEILDELEDEVKDKNRDLEDLYEDYYNADTEEEMEKVQKKIDSLESEIEELEAAIAEESVGRVINFIEVTTPITERDTIAYKVELSQLYYKAGDKDTATDLLTEAIRNEDEYTDTVADIMDELTELYQETGSDDSTDYAEEGVRELTVVWDRIAEILGIIPGSYDWSDDAFYNFLLQVMDNMFHGVIIRSIDSSDFPTVRVTVNIAMELEDTLTSKNFNVKDMGSEVDFKLLDAEEAEVEMGDTSIALVIDNSGSMSGDPIEDTKKAVTSFVKSADSSVRIGVTEFDNSAYVLASVGSSRNDILNAISSLYGSGGTSIYLGLQTAAEDLASESGRKIIILLSDGADGNADMIENVLYYLNNQNIIVYTIGVGSADSDYLSYIATSCGGKYIAAESSDVLNEIYAEIGHYIENDYILEFEAVTDLEDFSRELEVGIDLNGAYDEEEYHVGVAYEDIESEDGQEPYANYFQQIGGSWMDPDAYDDWDDWVDEDALLEEEETDEGSDEEGTDEEETDEGTDEGETDEEETGENEAQEDETDSGADDGEMTDESQEDEETITYGLPVETTPAAEI